MPRGDRGERTPPIELVLPVIGLLLAGFLAWGVGYLQARETYNRERSGAAYYAAAKDDAKRACVGREPSTVFECVRDKIETAQQTAHDEKDLTAQQRAASAALISAVLTFFALVISVIGVWYVKRTLDATLEAVEDTSRATDAMALTNQLTQQAQRPWIAIEASVPRIDYENEKIRIIFKVSFKNIGQTVAEGFWHYVDASPRGHDWRQGVTSLREHWALPKGPSPVSIMPGESYDYTGMFMLAANHLAWEGDTDPRIYLIIAATAYYQLPDVPEFSERKQTDRNFAIGFRGDHPVSLFYILRRDLRTAEGDEVTVLKAGVGRTI